jgi:hypothetical protein
MDPRESAADAEPDLLPVRMLNEYVYCPRLFHLMHVEGRTLNNLVDRVGMIASRTCTQIVVYDWRDWAAPGL